MRVRSRKTAARSLRAAVGVFTLHVGDELNLDLCVLRQARDLNRGTSRAGTFGEERGIDGVHGGKVIHVGEEDGCLHDVCHRAAGGFKNCLAVGERLLRLRGIRCGYKPTSCPDQLATALEQAKAKAAKV